MNRHSLGPSLLCCLALLSPRETSAEPCVVVLADRLYDSHSGYLVNGDELVECVRLLQLRVARFDATQPPVPRDYRPAFTNRQRSLFIQLPASWKSFQFQYLAEDKSFAALPGAVDALLLADDSIFEHVPPDRLRLKDGVTFQSDKLNLKSEALHACVGVRAINDLSRAVQAYSAETADDYQDAREHVLKVAKGFNELAAKHDAKGKALESQKGDIVQELRSPAPPADKVDATRRLNIATQTAAMEKQRLLENQHVAKQYMKAVEQADTIVKRKKAMR